MNFDLPYRANRAPVMAANMVSTSQPLATQAGVRVLQQGGNAVDAALAAAITLTVVEPCNNGVGSDAFAILWDGHELVGINASGRSPRLWHPNHFAGRTQMPQIGWDTVTVPGAVSSWVALSQRYGKLPFADLFSDAIRYARDGFQVGPVTREVWAQSLPMFSRFEEFTRHFGPLPSPGDLFKRPDLAGTLESIADSAGESFYRGELAERISAASEAAGGLLRATDLAEHEPMWVSPLSQAYRDITLHEIPPNGQGLAAQIALAILAHHEIAELDSAAAIHVAAEAMKIAIRAAFDHFADPQAMRVSPAELLGAEAIRTAAAGITDRAAPLPPRALPVSHDTVYLCAADADGLMVSFIQSNYKGFGSGIVIPGTGIAMQNRGSGFNLQAGHANEVGPRKLPFHTIIPGFVSQSGAPQLAFGVMGGHMQAQGHVQMVQRIFDYQQNPQAASDAPRWIVYEDFSVGLEPGVPETVASDLARRGHQVRYDDNVNTFGGAQLIYRSEDGYIAGSDHRKEGHAAGF
ncbi:MAG: gamma-glutamyltransferase family protein [Pseudomonadota bacterium]